MNDHQEPLYRCDVCGRGGFTAKGLKVHNCVPERGASVLPARQVAFDQELMGRQLEEQFDKATRGTFEILMFGAMMQHLTARMDELMPGRPKAGPGAYEGSLKQWISEHAPKVNYSTAMGFKSLATGLSRKFELEDTELYRLLSSGDDLDKVERKKRDVILAAIEGRTQRDLQIEFRFARQVDQQRPPKLARPQATPRQFIRDSLAALRKSCQEVVHLKSTLNKAEMDNACWRVLDTLEELTGCGWSPDENKERGKREFAQHADLSAEG